jgi:glutamate synthase (NADPH/NADH) small chain
MPKLDLNRQPMPAQGAKKCIKNFEEVALGYGSEQAKAEASRCLQCRNRPCVKACPLRIDIPGFIQALNGGDVPKAAEIIKEKSSLFFACGRVCPEASNCEASCNLAKRGAPVAIAGLARYVGDWDRASRSN